MRLRIRADVPMAFCLSGGVDSVSLTSIAVKVFGAKVETYSIIDSDERYNEWENISATIDDLSCNNIAIHLEPDSHLAKLKDLISHIDQPIATITYYIFSLLIEHLASRGIKTVITGTGADELLTGYYDHFILHLNHIRGTSLYAQRLTEWQEYILPIVRNPFLQDPDLYHKNPDFRDHIYFKQEEFAEYLHVPFYEQFTETNYHSDLLKSRMLNELFHESSRVIVNEVDKITMRYSVEGRNPFLDRRLFEFAYSIPSALFIENGYGKSVLRDAMRGIINDKVRLDRHKRGFNASIASIVDFQHPEVREAILDDSPIYHLIKKDMIEKAMSQKTFPNSFSKFLFYFLSSKFFLEQRSSGCL
jgi:asparagine synthase (glutamine-hydrolysing)